MPLLARLDGRSFHSFTKGLPRPFDQRLINCMTETAQFLLKEFKADLVYTQSDEITLFWNTDAEKEIFFNGKIFKLNSVIASSCSVFFYKKILEFLPEKSDKVPVFDCRTWQVPSLHDVSDVFIWRQLDAVRNSINSLAQANFPHRELQNKNKKEVLEMLENKNIFWKDLEMGIRRGYYFSKYQQEEELDFTNREDMPAHERHKKIVIRKKIKELDIPLLKENDYLFDHIEVTNVT